MARTQLAHFEHHRREIQLTRRRFQVSLLLLFISLSVVVGLQFHGSNAATATPEIASGIAGKCLDDLNNGTANDNPADISTCTGSAAQQWTIGGNTVVIHGKCLDALKNGTANGTLVELFGCNGGANQFWTKSGKTLVNKLSGKCLDDPASSTKNGTQLDIYTCNGTSAQVWTVSSFNPPTPPPTPAPTPNPTPVPTVKPPVHTPTPAPHTPVPKPVGLAPAPGGGGGGVAPENPAAPGDGSDGSTAASPDAPQGFSAMVSGSNAVVDLSWMASDDAAGIAAYQLERSIDETNWTVLSSTITDTSYGDSSVDFGIDYYYRIKAVDNAGIASDYSTAEASTPAFVTNAGSGSATTYVSDNKLASVVLPTGAVESDADCSLTDDAVLKVGSAQQRLVSGPFTLVCKDSQGDLISDFSKPLAWTFYLKNKLKGLEDSAAYSADDTGKMTLIRNSKFNSASTTLAFTTATSDSVLVLADVTPGVSWSLVVTLLMVIAAIGGVLVMVLRKKQKNNYDEYLRSKYYNL